jgi:hypothetical protein
MPVKNRILFIFSLYRFLEDVTRWAGTSLWGITLPNIDSVLIWRQTTIREANVSCWATDSWRAWEAHFARTRQLTLSPCFSQARMEEKSREFAEKGNEIYAN